MYFGLQQASQMAAPSGIETPYLSWYGVPGADSSVDLSPAVVALSDAPTGWRICTRETPFGSEAVDLGSGTSLKEISATTRLKDAWNTAFGVRPTGATLADVLHAQMDKHADDAGETSCKPVRAEGRTQRIWLANQIASEVTIDPAGTALQKAAFAREIVRAQRELNAVRDQAERGEVPADLHLKMISDVARKLGVRADDIKPAKWRADERPKQPETTVTDDFTGNLSAYSSIYNGTAPTWAISANKLQLSAVWDGIKLLVHGTTMSSVDMWTQANLYEVNGSGHGSIYVGVITRYGGNAKQCYGFMLAYNGDQSCAVYLVRVGTTGSVAAYLNSSTAYAHTYAPVVGYTPTLEQKSVSTSISYLITGTPSNLGRTTVTDGNITTGTQGGFFTPGDQNVNNVPKFSGVTITDGVTPAPVVTSESASGQVGTAFSYQIVGTNTPTEYAASELPSGLSVNTTTGLVTGNPAQSGTFSIPIAATNAGGTGTGTLTLVIAAKPASASRFARLFPRAGGSLHQF